jgi:hypothetical protein
MEHNKFCDIDLFAPSLFNNAIPTQKGAEIALLLQQQGYRLDSQGVGVRFPVEVSFLSALMTRLARAHPANLTMGTMESYLGGKVAGH